MNDVRVWADGAISAAHEFTLPLSSDASLRGISVFEGIKAYRSHSDDSYCVVSLHRHIVRLEQSAALMHLPVEKLASRVIEGIEALLKCETRDEVYLRPTIYLKSGYYGEIAETGLFILTRSAVAERTPLRCKISSLRHLPATCYPSDAKTGAIYAFFRLARLEAAKSGADEAILLATDGSVAETPGASVFVVSKGRVVTPPLSVGILPSITRLTAMSILRDQLSANVVEHLVSVDMLTNADEVFLTGTLDEIRSVSAVDGREIGLRCRPVSTGLLNAYLSACYSGIPSAPPDSERMNGACRE